MSEGRKIIPWRGYLGDGAYIKSGRFGGEVIVCTSNGIYDENQIYLERSAAAQLNRILTAWLSRNVMKDLEIEDE